MQQIGKSLPESIVDYILEVGGINFKLDRLKSDYVSKDELPSFLESQHFVSKRDLQQERGELERQINATLVKISEVENGRKQQGSDLTLIRQMFLEKADLKDIKVLEQKVNECAPWEAVR